MLIDTKNCTVIIIPMVAYAKGETKDLPSFLQKWGDRIADEGYKEPDENVYILGDNDD
ncbi:hypothetical protein FF098_015875 [Parvularcula flava]|uniref:Uncharacterized protein n=1 Tax=Aquisalinus luteolus TaxID=1566827 RepID=A0A8J3A9X4_9PROT|nr:hypothetical protein [Aquisalinus luteolus]NHK29394.1 hypothetical protein [Aquisalinus luteolus]GGI00906.1 hypothetical protein GCM10011355_30290 [Aquisalinus luteolus]